MTDPKIEPTKIGGPIEYRSGYKYQLATEYTIFLPRGLIPNKPIETRFFTIGTDGLLIVRPGYAWDGPSGPTIDTKTFMRGSLLHDIPYQCMRLGLLPPSAKPYADKLLQRVCLEDGMNRLRAWYVYRSVLKLAGSAASPKNVKKIHRAPKKMRSLDL